MATISVCVFACAIAVQACTTGEVVEGPAKSETKPPPAAAGDATASSSLAAFKQLSPDSPLTLPADKTNAFADDPRAADLGQRFFFDTRFSGALLDTDNNGLPPALGNAGDTSKVACASCHMPTAGFTDSRSVRGQISLAAGWTRRRTRSLLDVGHTTLVMWDGRKDALWNQVFEPIESAVEFNAARLFVAQQIAKEPLYRKAYETLFGAMPNVDDAAEFPQLTAAGAGCRALSIDGIGVECHGLPGDHAEYDGLTEAKKVAVTRIVVNFGKSVEAYLRRLSCGTSRFDAFVHGDANAMTLEEQRGAALFVGKAECVRCHSGPRLTDERFHNVGLKPALVAQFFTDRDDRGAAVGIAKVLVDPLNTRSAYADGNDDRLPESASPTFEGAFRTPSLRCVTKRRSFTHTGQFRLLGDVVAFFNRGGDASGFPGSSELHPLNLSDEERADLAAFLRALDGPGPAATLMAAPQ